MTLETFVLACKRNAHAIPAGGNKTLCRVLDGDRIMFVDSNDVACWPSLVMNGVYDANVLFALANEVPLCSVIADIGACFGLYSLFLAERCSKIYCFEPNGRVFSLLKLNVEINSLHNNVAVYPLALGDTQYPNGKLFTNRKRFNAATMSPAGIKANGSLDAETVKVETLDTLGIKPDFILLSACGYEPQIWNGMRGALNAKRKVGVMVEYTPRWYADAQAFATEIFDAGFAVRRILPTGDTESVPSPEMLPKMGRSHLLLSR